jgi:hypothetical protein
MVGHHKTEETSMTIAFDTKLNDEGKIERLMIVDSTTGAQITLSRSNILKLLEALDEDLAVIDGEFTLVR